jgi:D-aspartate ligase
MHSPISWKPGAPALLTMPAYGGTLAAVRQLGSNGVQVIVAGHQILDAARWSNHASGFVSCPPVQETERFVEWLIDYGERTPGHVLLPTSDKTAFLFSSNLKLLETCFRLYQPPVETMIRILDKRRLAEACSQVGLDVMPSWFPSGETELRVLARKLPYPLLIKPRTQIRRLGREKGVIVRNLDDLLPAYRAFVAREHYLRGLSELGDADKPMLQQFAEVANQAVHSVAGFIDRSGEMIAARGTKKVLQRMPPVGIGVCFEAAPPDDILVEAIRRLCREVGYFGVFEIEFLRLDHGWAVIDFNPRFYHQMGFDIARGLALPIWAYLGACGQEALLRSVMSDAGVPEGSPTAFCDGFTFRALLTVMMITGRLSKVEAARWRRWYKDHRGRTVDIAAASRDRLPGFVHALSEVTLGLAAMPRFLRRPSPTSQGNAELTR